MPVPKPTATDLRFKHPFGLGNNVLKMPQSVPFPWPIPQHLKQLLFALLV